MRQIIYFSTAATHQSRDVIEEILIASRRNNARDNISGLLVAGGHRYLQLIEGPRQATTALYRQIAADPRHVSVTKLVDRSVSERNFDGWAMAFTEEPALGTFSSFPDLVAHTASSVADIGLRRQVRCFGEIFTAAPPLVSSPWTTRA